MQVFWLFQGALKVSSGTDTRYRSSYGTGFDNSELASPVKRQSPERQQYLKERPCGPFLEVLGHCCFSNFLILGKELHLHYHSRDVC